MRYITKFNKQVGDNHNILKKALTTASGVGAALIPENLETIITDTIIRLSPELALMTTKKISGKIHEFVQKTENPASGGAVGENATTPVTNSKTTRQTVTLKVFRRKGQVTDFIADTAEDYIDAMAFEMENHLQAHILDLIYYLYWGNANSNAYEIDGLEQLITTNRVAFSTAATGVVPTNLSFLDAMIDASNRSGGQRHRRVFAMTPEMLSVVSGLLTNVRLNQGQSGLTEVEIPGGWRLNAYRDIPIIETTSLGPIEAMSATVTATGATTGGTLAAGNYYIQVVPITYEGEQSIGTEKVANVASGTTGKITISINAQHQTNGIDSALAYKVYAGTTTGAANLVPVAMVSAFTYDANGTPTRDNLETGNELVLTSLTPALSIPAHMQADIPLAKDGTSNKYAESVVLWDLDPIQGLGKMPFTNTSGDSFNGLITTKELATTDDYEQFLTKSYCALAPSFEKTSYWLRNIRTQ